MRVISLDGETSSIPFCAFRLLISAYIRLFGKSTSNSAKETDTDGLRWSVRIVGKDYILLSAEANAHRVSRLKQRREAIEALLLEYKSRRKQLIPGWEQTKAAGAKDAHASFQAQIDELDAKTKVGEMGIENIDATLAALEKGVVKQIRFPYDEELFASMQSDLYAANQAPKNGGEKKTK